MVMVMVMVMVMMMVMMMMMMIIMMFIKIIIIVVTLKSLHLRQAIGPAIVFLEKTNQELDFKISFGPDFSPT